MNSIRSAAGKIFLCLFFAAGCAHAARPANQVCLQKSCFNVELALTDLQMARGLQFRKTLPRKNGMLFIFQKDGNYAFWMKDTLIPLDLIWLNAGREIVHIAKDVPPCRQDPCPNYKPGAPSRYVLEINAGLAQKLGFKIGDRAAIRLNTYGQPL